MTSRVEPAEERAKVKAALSRMDRAGAYGAQALSNLPPADEPEARRAALAEHLDVMAELAGLN